MLIDARTLDEGATLEADVCIAGAGAAGMTIAMDLRGSGLSVVLLESGGVERDEATQALSEGRMTGIDTWDLRRMRIRSLGGTTGHWNGWCRPLMPQDFERRDYIPDSGWPLKYSDLVRWFRKACQTLEIGEFEWDADERSERTSKPLLPVSSNIEQRYYQFSPPTRFSTCLRPGAGTGRGRPRRHLRQPRRHPSGSDPRARRGLRVPDAGGDDLSGERRALRARVGWCRERPRAPGVAIAAARGRGQRPRRGGPLLHGASALLRLDRRSACVGARPVVLQAR